MKKLKLNKLEVIATIIFVSVVFIACLFVRDQMVDNTMKEVNIIIEDRLKGIHWTGDYLGGVEIGLFPDWDGDGIGGIIYRNEKAKAQ